MIKEDKVVGGGMAEDIFQLTINLSTPNYKIV